MINKKILVPAILVLLVIGSALAVPPILIKGGTIMTVTKGTIENGDILLQNGKIKKVGKDLPAPKDCMVIDGAGKFVTPGIIDAHSHIGVYSWPGVSAHRDGNDPVGGAIANDRGWWNTAVKMAKFSWWLPGGRAASRPEIAADNSSYSRALWETVGPFLGTRFAGDSELNWRVRAGGRQIWFEPRAIVAHRHQAGFLRVLNERFVRGRDFGATRVER